MEEEESAHDKCSIVYFCSSAPEDIHQVYHKSSAPEPPSNESGHVACIYHNVRALLDEDQGDYNEVFLSSRAQQCADRLESLANNVSTIILVELPNSSDAVKDHSTGPFAFLRRLAGDIRGARFQKHVMPFVLLTFDGQPRPEIEVNHDVTSACLEAGAIAMLRSPLPHDDINRMIGHFKEKNRPPAHLIGAPMAQNLVDSIHDVSKPPRAPVYRFDEVLSAQRKAAVEDAVHRWHFPAQDFNMDELSYAAMYMIEHVLSSPELAAYTLERRQLVALLLATRRQYKHESEVHYHNWRHAVDVSQCIFCFLLDLQLCPPLGSERPQGRQPTLLEQILTPLDGLILLISAIGHDVGHPGVNNAFLVACNHPLAQTYNDKSVLENYHCAAYQQLLRRHWPALNQISGFRATMIATILATDMQRHFEYMSHLNELKGRLEEDQETVDQWSDKDRDSTKETLMALLIKAADISNVARPFEVAARWARILMYEFARQGELESELQIPTCLFGGPPDTEDMLAAAQSQKGFLNLFGRPLFQGIAEVMPALTSVEQELERNQERWDRRIDEEKQCREPESSATRPHFGSVTKDDVEEAQLEQRRSEPSAVPLEAIQSPLTPTVRVAAEQTDIPSSNHGAHDLKQHLTWGATRNNDDKRASAPMLAQASIPLLSPGLSTRRSSKDIALDQLQQLNAIAHHHTNSGSRRGSADAGWQVHQSYPNSRRGSKDESLTTIYVASGAAQNRRSSPSSPGKRLSPVKATNKKQHGVAGSPKGSTAARNSVPFVSPPSSNAALATSVPSPGSTSPGSPLSPELGMTTPLNAVTSIPSTEDPFILPGTWPNDLDGTHRASQQVETVEALHSTPPPPPQFDLAKSESASMSTREVDEGDDNSAMGEAGLHGSRSRSRSRLRGLKFWKKKKGREVTGVEARGSPPATP